MSARLVSPRRDRTTRLCLAVLVVGVVARGLDGASSSAQPPAEPTGSSPHGGGASALPEGHAPVSDDALMRVLTGGVVVATAEPSSDVPAGAVDVSVVDVHGAPLGGVPVRLGSMQQGTRLPPRNAVTDALGRVRFRPEGTAGAHRVSVEFEGVKVSTAPFTLEPARGVRVQLRRLPVDRDTSTLFNLRVQLVVEWKPERIHISESIALTHARETMLALPADGLPCALPEGFEAFEAQPSMGDQRLVASDEGFRLHGSLPPGNTELQFTFDLPLRGQSADVRVPLLTDRTIQAMVVVDAAEGMDLEVERFQPARRLEYGGKSLLVSEFEFSPTDPPLGPVRIQIRDIPGRNGSRDAAIALAILATLGGLYAAYRAHAAAPERPRGEPEAIADAIVALEAEHARGEIGDVYLRRERERLLDELAFALRHAAVGAESRTKAS